MKVLVQPHLRHSLFITLFLIFIIFSSVYALDCEWKLDFPSAANEELLSVWGTSSTNVFTVGSNGTILHFDGSTWSYMTSPVTDHLLGIWGNSASDIYAVGYDGVVLRYDGSVWSVMISGYGCYLWAGNHPRWNPFSSFPYQTTS